MHFYSYSASTRRLFLATKISTAFCEKADEPQLCCYLNVCTALATITIFLNVFFFFQNVVRHFFFLDPLWEKMCIMLIALPRGNRAFNLTCAKGERRQNFSAKCFSNVH